MQVGYLHENQAGDAGQYCVTQCITRHSPNTSKLDQFLLETQTWRTRDYSSIASHLSQTLNKSVECACYIYYIYLIITFNQQLLKCLGWVFCPGKSFGLKFIPNQLDVFWFILKSVSILNATYPSQYEVFDLVWCELVKNLSDLIRDVESKWIRTNFSILMNSRSELFGLGIWFEIVWFWIYSDWKARIQSSFGLLRDESWFGLKFWIDSDWILVRIKNLGLIRIKFFGSD